MHELVEETKQLNAQVRGPLAAGVQMDGVLSVIRRRSGRASAAARAGRRELIETLDTGLILRLEHELARILQI